MNNNSLELKRIKLEKERVALARKEMEFKIEELLESIDRIKDNIKIQSNKEIELEKRIQELERK